MCICNCSVWYCVRSYVTCIDLHCHDFFDQYCLNSRAPPFGRRLRGSHLGNRCHPAATVYLDSASLQPFNSGECWACRAWFYIFKLPMYTHLHSRRKLKKYSVQCLLINAFCTASSSRSSSESEPSSFEFEFELELWPSPAVWFRSLLMMWRHHYTSDSPQTKQTMFLQFYSTSPPGMLPNPSSFKKSCNAAYLLVQMLYFWCFSFFLTEKTFKTTSKVLKTLTARCCKSSAWWIKEGYTGLALTPSGMSSSTSLKEFSRHLR